ncbi:MAG: hypothetical protein WBB74_10745 [Gaiellaceae bacterium]
MKRFALLLLAALGVVAVGAIASPARAAEVRSCTENSATCTETLDPIGYEGQYTGHDEPSLLFYSNTPGSGNSQVYKLTLPTDPPVQPNQAGTAGTFSFQLHPAFWFGVAMCDTQSSPEYTNVCVPDSDGNIFTSDNPHSANYIGKHPGTAFMEMQFYPPSWVPWPAGNSCDPTRWCAALNIDSFSQDQNSGQFNNNDCRNKAGDEPVNFAFITKSGIPHASPDPVTLFQPPFSALTVDPTKDFFMNSGDQLVVDLHDTASGLQIVIHDLTSGKSGSMTASAANDFRQVLFQPGSPTCHSAPYDFHPMYSTSSENTRVVWAAHSYNVAFSDEIGHFEYCNAADPNTGACTSAGVSEPNGQLDADDQFCFNPSDSLLVQIGGCTATETDFDGVPYQPVWPGTNPNLGQDKKYHSSPILFTSPLFTDGSGFQQNFDRVAFEVDLPRIEFATNPPCQRHISNPADPSPGSGCVNPPAGANFYPLYTTRTSSSGSCVWQLGGRFLKGTTNTFGGTSTTEFGPLLASDYPNTGFTITERYNNFRNILSTNPCPR